MINLIAEIGINHNGDMDICKKLIDVANVSGFDYVKFQKRDIDVAVPEWKKNEPKSTPWGDMTYYEYKKRIEFHEEQYDEIRDICKDRGMKWLASVWDVNSAEFMKKYMNIAKIPSALITDIELLEYCRDNYETVIMSTGMSTEEEIEKAMVACNPDVVLHSHSAYPAPVDELNLNYIKWLSDKYDCEIGYSGHEYGLSTTYPTASMGVTWIERHITLDHGMWGSDHKSSVDPVGCIKFVRTIRDIEKTLHGYGPRNVMESEKKKRKDLRK